MRSVKILSVRYRLQVETHNSTVRSRVLTTRGVLSMKYKDGKWRPVVFISKSLNTIERNYDKGGKRDY